VTDADTAERLRLRYPRERVPRPVRVSVIALLAAVALWWLVVTGWRIASPAVSAQVVTFAVRSDTAMTVTMTVDRPDPSVAVHCRLIAQSADFQIVGEQSVAVPGGRIRLLNVQVDLTTLRRATSASTQGCTVD
jgi:hypothetical protein